MTHCSSPHPELPGFSAKTGQRIIDDGRPCYTVVVHLVGRGEEGRILITPTRRRAPLPKPSREPVTICWILAHPDLGWGEVGVTMKSGWETGWGMPVAIGDQYDLTIDGGPANKVNYPYGLDLTVEGRGIPTIDPEVEYDNDF
jgi:hypothetical protein